MEGLEKNSNENSEEISEKIGNSLNELFEGPSFNDSLPVGQIQQKVKEKLDKDGIETSDLEIEVSPSHTSLTSHEDEILNTGEEKFGYLVVIKKDNKDIFNFDFITGDKSW